MAAVNVDPARGVAALPPGQTSHVVFVTAWTCSGTLNRSMQQRG